MTATIECNPNARGKQKFPRLRCAIYTRKSTEEGLEQDFNSLDAQREACEAYITSQSSLGWRLSPRHYDDGGISGGTMERPALGQLLNDVKAGLLDNIVVYKIDRLTRSLMDFARMVDLFDDKGISFVSVTQQFNTTTSMGRLTLNVLLSFAQFEREVTAERIRDKIAASKKKGMWMGGVVPLGYQTENKKLFINNAEAKIIGSLYLRYLELGSVSKLSIEARKNGLVGRSVVSKNGSVRKTNPFGRGNLYHLLSNPIYIGMIKHQDQIYEGQHEAIIEIDVWETVQAELKANAANRRLGTNSKSPNLFIGLIYDEANRLLTPTHSIKKGKRYYYYISSQNTSKGANNNQTKPTMNWRISAKYLDDTILQILKDNLQNPLKLSKLIDFDKATIDGQKTIIEAASKLVKNLEDADISQQKEILTSIVDHIQLTQSEITIHIKTTELCTGFASSDEPNIKSITCDYTLQKRGVKSKLILSNELGRTPNLDDKLIMLIAKAKFWLQKLTDGSAVSISELSIQQDEDRNEISRLLPLAFLCPAIVESIVQGTQPINLTAERLRRLSDIPMDWDAQRRLLGFAG